MSGIWFGLATVAVGLVIRWYIINEAALSQRPSKSENSQKKK